jgi:Na+-translocating ferredoxin:NAD+ oxidoreductase RnfD subunit
VTWLEWAPGFMLLSLYFTCLYTVCAMTCQKGRTVFGAVGIFVPWLWLVGAFLPAKKGSRYELAQQIADQRQVEQYAQ